MHRHVVSAVVFAALLVGCAHETIVLLPSQDGKPSAVVVSTSRGTTTLDAPYATARTRFGATRADRLDAAAVKTAFGDTLGALPQRPVSFMLYFIEDSDEYTPESRAEIEHVFAELTRRPAPEIAVIGHTDRIGAVDYNDGLSLRRAERVRDDLIGQGIPAASISAAGRGEREPLVQTADEVTEPRNRRVELNVR